MISLSWFHHFGWKQVHTCFPLWILFLLRTGVLPVVTHTPASVLLYTSFSSMTPWPFSCCTTKKLLHCLVDYAINNP